MWPFGRKTHDLIEAGYLNDRGISIEYRDAFNRKRKELKSEVKRNERIKSENQEKISDLETRIRTNQMKKSELEATLKVWLADKEGSNDQEIEKLGLEIDQIVALNDRYIADQNASRQRVDNCMETVAMLNAIISGTKTSPKQLTQDAIRAQGGHVDREKDETPRAWEVSDASEYREAYGSSESSEQSASEEE
jgi:hypothetical protein